MQGMFSTRGGSPSPIHCFSVQLNREAQKLVQKFCKIMQSGNFPIFEHSFVAYWSSRLYNMQLFKKGMTSNEMLCWSVLCSSWWQASSLNSMRGGTCHSPLQIVTPPLQNVTPLQIVTPPCKLSLLPANCHSPLANCHSPTNCHSSLQIGTHFDCQPAPQPGLGWNCCKFLPTFYSRCSVAM